MADLTAQLLNAAAAHTSGALAEAERLYREIIERDASIARAWNQLGAVLFQRGTVHEALDCFKRSLALAPDDHVSLSSVAIIYRHLGRIEEAVAAAEQALALAPNDPHCLINLECLYRDAGQTLRAAELLAQGTRAHVGDLEATLLLRSARLSLEVGAEDRALVQAHRALEILGPTNEALRLLLAVLSDRPDCRLEAATLARLLQAARPNPTALVPALARVLAAQSHLLWCLGEQELSLSCLERALAADPGDERTRTALAITLHRLDRSKEAIALLRAESGLNPQEYAVREVNIGCILTERGDPGEAQIAFERALAADPLSLMAVWNLANLHARQANHRRARVCYSNARGMSDSIPLRLEAAASPLIIASSQTEIDEWRARFEEAISELERTDALIEDPLRQAGFTNFYLAYHGRDNRALHERWSRLLTRLSPGLRWTSNRLEQSAGKRRLRVGFISSHFFLHSIGKTTVGLIEQLNRSGFEVVVLFVGRLQNDLIAQRIARAADRWFDVPATLADAREAIAQLQLDLLFYPDLGMDCFTWYLAHSRLAPVQCTSFGHPDTTGIEPIDYFISTRLTEPPDARRQYSERLIELPQTAIPAYYYAPPVAAVQSARARLGLPEASNLYLCAQAPFKLHPDMDALFRGILEADRRAEIILIEAPKPSWNEALKTRLREQVSRELKGIRFLPRLPYRDFLALLGTADVALDTIHFNGMNTSLEALHTGTPVVCMRGSHQRSRHTSAMLTRMDLTELVADSPEAYIETAVRLASDSATLARMRNTVRERSEVLFADHSAAEGFADIFMSLCG